MILRGLLLLCYCATSYSYQADNYVVMMNNDDVEQWNKEISQKEMNGFLEDEPRDKPYQATWDSLDKRPIPDWYEDGKIGVFIHWGVFSVPSFGSEWFWKNWKSESGKKYQDFMKAHYAPDFSYQEFARDFTAEFFNATQWSELFKAAGARYVVLTSKHHEGFTLWPSKYSFSWNSVDVGPHKDLVGDLAQAVRQNTDLKFGLYHSMYEWFNPMYLNDKNNNFETDTFVTQKIYPELLELVNNYHPEVIWSDGDWDASDTYWKSKEFLAWLYNDSPVKDTVVVNDRWGSNIPCHHGGYYTCTDRYNPGVLQPHKWENCMTIDRNSWGFRRNAVLADYLSLKELVHELVVTVSCGGNLLMNVGPTKDGIIAPIFEERLRGLGAWLAVNGEAIYGSRPWSVQNDTTTGDVWYTQSANKQNLYATLLSWPKYDTLCLGAKEIPDNPQILLLSNSVKLKWKKVGETICVSLPADANKGEPAWTLRFQKKE
ncbi:alpha-L-fucosidase isoform X1 [Neodiprion lecontei]|uniref:Putative alpha-L-fucosidase n=1 Tax=Neodiprion lecontei TaxID=441921 RepID=A0A6J0B335_NEOLC|nr:alpha-L-fucosidase isoform X1 [Neodiprion lecontei]XP_046588547.1 alpha-L-fucosidase isoform X1 [Neodiprion lecontei]